MRYSNGATTLFISRRSLGARIPCVISKENRYFVQALRLSKEQRNGASW